MVSNQSLDKFSVDWLIKLTVVDLIIITLTLSIIILVKNYLITLPLTTSLISRTKSIKTFRIISKSKLLTVINATTTSDIIIIKLSLVKCN